MASSELAADQNGRASFWTPGERGRLSREQEEQVQRARIMRAAAQVVAERGFAGASIKQVTQAAGVSRATFYDLFDNFEQCFLAVLDAAMRRTIARIADAFAQNTTWQERAVAGLAVLLGALDADPYMARVCLVEALAAGPAALAYHAREIELLKQPYFDEQTVAQAHERAGRLAQELAREHAAQRPRPATDTVIPKALRNPRAHRSRECLRYLATHPGASNRSVGEGIGLTRLEQAAGLLARLANEGLLAKQTGGPGRPNAWSLTPHGERIARALEATH
jgi:AcrR family transcriptional regulator